LVEGLTAIPEGEFTAKLPTIELVATLMIVTLEELRTKTYSFVAPIAYDESSTGILAITEFDEESITSTDGPVQT
jgi:hypothetical protein